MNYGLHLSASGTLTSMNRLDVAANNLANVNTVGFKPDISIPFARHPASVEDNLPFLGSDAMLEKLGGGVHLSPTRTDFAPGAPRITENPLDVAILGDGFFVLDSGRGGEGDQALRFSRDGRFTIGPEGRLTHVGSGMPALDDRGRPIRLDPSRSAMIDNGGRVIQEGEQIAQLQLTAFDDPTALKKAGDNLYGVRDDVVADRRAADTLLKPGAVESSSVDPISAMMAVTKASGAAQNNLRMIRIHDELMERTINTFGRVG